MDVFLSPLTWAVLLCLLGLWRKRPWMRWASALAAAELVLFSLAPVANALLVHLEGQAVRSARQDITYDAVILLGGLVDHAPTAAHGVPSYDDNIERLLISYDLLRTGRAKNVIVTGGFGWPGDRVNEARTLARQLEDWGIAPERIILETRAFNTRGNAVESKRLVQQLGYRTLLVVTSAYHMARALDCFRAVGLNVHALPVDYRASGKEGKRDWLPRSGYLHTSTFVLREIFGRWVYRVTGYGKARAPEQASRGDFDGKRPGWQSGSVAPAQGHAAWHVPGWAARSRDFGIDVDALWAALGGPERQHREKVAALVAQAEQARSRGAPLERLEAWLSSQESP